MPRMQATVFVDTPTPNPIPSSDPNSTSSVSGNDFDQFMRQRTGRAKRESKRTGVTVAAPSADDFTSFIQQRQSSTSPSRPDDRPLPASAVTELLEHKPIASKPERPLSGPALSKVLESAPTDEEWYKRLPWYSRAAASFNENFGISISAQRDPVTALKGLGMAARHPGLEWESLKEMYNSMNAAQQDVIDRAYYLQHTPGVLHKAEGFAMGVYASIPVLGPAVVHALDKWHSGDHAGAVGALSAVGTQALAPAASEIHPLEAAKRVGETVSGLPAKISSRATAAVQHMAGTGPRLAEKVTEKTVKGVETANQAELAKAAKAEAKHAEAQAEYDTKISQINEDFDSKISKVRQQYADDAAIRDKKVSELQSQHADKVAETRREWVEKTHAARETEQAQAKIEGRREALRSQQKSYAGLVKENVKAAHDNTRASLDARWNQLRETVGTESPVLPSGIYDAVEASRAMLAGVPADLKIFNDIFKEITEPGEQIDTGEGPKPVVKEYISFDDARTQYSAIGEKAYAAEGNLRRALFNVYEAYDKALSKTATDAGAGKQYAALKRDWSQYMKDWHDMSSTSTGGSPLARLHRAVDSPVVIANVAGKFGDRLIATFARYTDNGANPVLMSKLRNSTQELSSLPKVKVTKPPGKFESPAEPKLPEPVESPTAKVAELESQRAKTISRTDQPAPVKLPELQPNPTVDEMIDTVRRAKVEKAKDFAAQQKWHIYDAIMATWSAFGIPDAMIEGTLSRATVHAAMYLGTRFGWMKFARSPMGMEWMTRVTPADVQMISKVLAKYPSERVEASRAIAETLEDTVRAGGPPPNIAKFAAILTPEQQREIMKTVKDINDLKALGIKPPDVTAQGVHGQPVPESSAAAGGSGTHAGAARDNADLAQARKNLGIPDGQWDPRLLSEAQRLKDARQANIKLYRGVEGKRPIKSSTGSTFFTDTPELAKKYENLKGEGGVTHEGHLRSGTNLIDANGNEEKLLRAGGYPGGALAMQLEWYKKAKDHASGGQSYLLDGAKALGYDGVILNEGNAGPKSYVLFNPDRDFIQNNEQGGHAGGSVSSAEEISRSGVNYVVSKSGQVTYHGKSFAPESTPLGATHVTVLADGTIRVNAGQTLTSAQEVALRNALKK